jgi:hypothetical protein
MTPEEQEKQLADLGHIRSMMERSSRFISLSGLSGVFVGIYALIGAAAAWYKTSQLQFGSFGAELRRHYWRATPETHDAVVFLVADAMLVLIASLLTSSLLTMRKANKHGQKVWDKTARRLMLNMMIPLAAGGIFALILLLKYYNTSLIPAVTLLFYGLALVNASKYTLEDVRYLGLCEIALGLIGAIFADYGLLFWAIGFGVLHIVYGLVLYRKYER